MHLLKSIVFFAFLFTCSSAFAQKIIYSQPENSDTRRMDFEVIGKVSGNFLIYKNIRDKSYISVYDNDMQQTAREEQDYIPGDRLINIDFFPYNDFAYLVYQYQKKNVVYCDAVKVDGKGKKVSDVVSLDTSHIGFAGNNKIYSAITSENKSQLLLYKINTRNKERFIVSTLLYNDQLALQKKSRFEIPMEERDDYLDEFSVDNDGDLVFVKSKRTNNEIVSEARLMWKPAQSDTLTEIPMKMKDIYLDEPHIKVDNVNKRYFFTSFYYKQKRGNIDGLYFNVWDKRSQSPAMENTVALGDEIRNEARGEASAKTAFNDYFIRNIIIKRDGGFLINTESYYTTSRMNNWNRWNYLYGFPMSAYDYYSPYSPLYNSWYWRNRYGNQQAVRHHADNLMVLSFDNTGKMQWNNVIHKEQFDDESSDRISYLMANTGGQLHYVFNVDEKRSLLLNDFTLSPTGDINHNPTLKNLDRGYEFMPKFGKQVSSYQVVIPCVYRNYICFAKIDFN